MTNLITVVTYHLEQNISLPQRTAFLESLNLLLTSCHYLESQIIANRLTRAVLPSITTVLFTTSSREDDGTLSSRSKRSKKRARNFEGEEVFKASRNVICPTFLHGRVLLVALDVIRDCVRNPSLSPAVHSTVSRLILSIALALPQIPPALLSPDPSLFERVYKQVRSLSVEIGTWSSSAMSRSLPLLLQTGLRVNDSEVRGFYLFTFPFLKKRFRYNVCSISFCTLASLLSFVQCHLSSPSPSFLQRGQRTKGRITTHFKWKRSIQAYDQ